MRLLGHGGCAQGRGRLESTFRKGDQPAGNTGGVCFGDDGKRLAYHVDKAVLVRSMEGDKVEKPAES